MSRSWRPVTSGAPSERTRSTRWVGCGVVESAVDLDEEVGLVAVVVGGTGSSARSRRGIVAG